MHYITQCISFFNFFTVLHNIRVHFKQKKTMSLSTYIEALISKIAMSTFIRILQEIQETTLRKNNDYQLLKTCSLNNWKHLVIICILKKDCYLGILISVIEFLIRERVFKRFFHIVCSMKNTTYSFFGTCYTKILTADAYLISSI